MERVYLFICITHLVICFSAFAIMEVHAIVAERQFVFLYPTGLFSVICTSLSCYAGHVSVFVAQINLKPLIVVFNTWTPRPRFPWWHFKVQSTTWHLVFSFVWRTSDWSSLILPLSMPRAVWHSDFWREKEKSFVSWLACGDYWASGLQFSSFARGYCVRFKLPLLDA